MSSDLLEFQAFPKMPRLSREIIITEKIDGTNAQVCITDDGEMLVGSRTKWITPQSDNVGLARWCEEHKQGLIEALGPGRHFGEWWGAGIRRKYAIGEKRFSLFNTTRWGEEDLPDFLHVVPELYRGPFSEEDIEQSLIDLQTGGSRASPGFMDPEGIIVFHVAANAGFKKTLDGDGGKWAGRV